MLSLAPRAASVQWVVSGVVAVFIGACYRYGMGGLIFASMGVLCHLGGGRTGVGGAWKVALTSAVTLLGVPLRLPPVFCPFATSISTYFRPC